MATARDERINEFVSVVSKNGWHLDRSGMNRGNNVVLSNDKTGETRQVTVTSRWTIKKGYMNQFLWIAFPDRACWYMVPHSELMLQAKKSGYIRTRSWNRDGVYNIRRMSDALLKQNQKYQIGENSAHQFLTASSSAQDVLQSNIPHLKSLGAVDEYHPIILDDVRIPVRNKQESSLRQRLVEITLMWQETYGVAPHVTAAISEYDASCLVGMPEQKYRDFMKDKTAVAKGADFAFNGVRYQVKANRPSSKKGSHVTLVPKARNYDWDRLFWILYRTNFDIQEAWLWDVEAYRDAFDSVNRLSPDHYRGGTRLA